MNFKKSILSLLVCTALGLSACGSAKKKDETAEPTKQTAKDQKADHATKSENQSLSQFTCEKGNDKRSVETKKVGEGCATEYTKAGAKETKASARKGTQWCEDVSKRIKKHLTEAGYSCK